jgi:cysteinyl-tRNA synthetase
MKFINEIANSVSSDDLDEEIASKAKLTIYTIVKILGLKIASVSPEDRNRIESMVKLREKLRKELKFKEADSIRLELANKYSVEVLDHKYRTTWLKTEYTSF